MKKQVVAGLWWQLQWYLLDAVGVMLNLVWLI